MAYLRENTLQVVHRLCGDDDVVGQADCAKIRDGNFLDCCAAGLEDFNLAFARSYYFWACVIKPVAENS